MTPKEIRIMARTLETAFPSFYGGSQLSRNVHVRTLEMVIHELAHAAVFGLKLVPGDDPGSHVGQRFDQYVSGFASDISEFKALAIEIEVLERLGVRERILVDRLVRDSSMQRGWTPAARWKQVRKYASGSLFDRRVARVMAWIEVAKDYVPIEWWFPEHVTFTFSA